MTEILLLDIFKIIDEYLYAKFVSSSMEHGAHMNEDLRKLRNKIKNKLIFDKIPIKKEYYPLKSQMEIRTEDLEEHEKLEEEWCDKCNEWHPFTWLYHNQSDTSYRYCKECDNPLDF